MNEARPFELVFVPGASENFQGEAGRRLAGALDPVIAGGFLKFLDSPPAVR